MLIISAKVRISEQIAKRKNIFFHFRIKSLAVLAFLCNFAPMDYKRYLLGLIREGEHQQQDFKYRVADAAKLAKSVSAFANTDGGRLLIGVRDDGNLSGVRSEEEIFMMHQAAWKYCRPQASIKFDTYHIDGHTIVIATVPPSERKPVCALNEEGLQRAYIRITDENIVASPVHLAIWREQQSERGTMMTYTDNVRQLLRSMDTQNPEGMPQHFTLNQLVRRSRLPRPKVITLLARLIRFGVARMDYYDQQFLFSLSAY